MRTFIDVLLWSLGGVIVAALILFACWELGWLT